MSDTNEPGFLSRYLPTFFLFCIGVMALVFFIISSVLTRNDARIRSMEQEEIAEPEES